MSQIGNNITLDAGTQDLFGAGPQKHSLATIPPCHESLQEEETKRQKKRHKDQGGHGKPLFLIRFNVRIRANLIFTVAGRGQVP